MTNKDRLKQLADEVPDGMAGEILDFAERLRAKQASEGMMLPARFWRRGRSSFRRRGGVKRGVLFTPPVFTPGSGP